MVAGLIAAGVPLPGMDALLSNTLPIGGGLSSLGRLYASVPLLWGRWVFSDRVDTRLLPPELPDQTD